MAKVKVRVEKEPFPGGVETRLYPVDGKGAGKILHSRGEKDRHAKYAAGKTYSVDFEALDAEAEEVSHERAAEIAEAQADAVNVGAVKRGRKGRK